MTMTDYSLVLLQLLKNLKCNKVVINIFIINCLYYVANNALFKAEKLFIIYLNAFLEPLLSAFYLCNKVESLLSPDYLFVQKYPSSKQQSVNVLPLLPHPTMRGQSRAAVACRGSSSHLAGGRCSPPCSHPAAGAPAAQTSSPCSCTWRTYTGSPAGGEEINAALAPPNPLLN